MDNETKTQSVRLYLAVAHQTQVAIEHEAAPSLIDNWIERKPEHLWTDALNPSPEALSYLRERFRLHPLAIEECDHAGVRPKIEQFEQHLYIVLHGINHNPGEDRLDTIEFKIFLRPQLLITVHDKASTSIQTTQARLSRDPTVLSRHGVDTVLHHIVDAIVDHYFPLLEMMEGQLENLESEIFRSPDDHLLEAMLVLQRKFLTLHRIVHPQLDILGALSSGRFAEIEAADLAYFRDVYDHLERISDRIQIAREMLNGAMQCYLSHVSNKTNMVMKGLTILATVVLPATLLTSIWGMNVTAIPGQNFAGTFWIVIGASATLSILLLFVLRRLRWL